MTATVSPVARSFDPETMLRLQGKPLYGIDGFAVNGGEAVVTGLALAPDGDASRVSISAAAGMAASLTYPAGPNPGAADFYWYWKNAGNSVYRVGVDLAATTDEGPLFRFRFHFEGEPEDVFEDIRTTVVAPKNLQAYQNYPTAGSMKRVQHFDTIAGVVTKGASDALRIARLAQAYGVDPAGAVLDWGVGHGRVVRHLPLHGMTGPLHGIDIDPDNVAWGRAHLKGVAFEHGPLMPPSPYAPASFDLVFGISVMTHLSRNVQQAWLDEIARILKPGAIALVTFAGDAAVAFGSRYFRPDWMRTYLETGAAPDLPDPSLVGVIDDPDYYKNVYISAERATELCRQHLEVAGVHRCMFGYQDLLVLRKPA
jgi:SAM-dependent methyltransferase